MDIKPNLTLKYHKSQCTEYFDHYKTEHDDKLVFLCYKNEHETYEWYGKEKKKSWFFPSKIGIFHKNYREKKAWNFDNGYKYQKDIFEIVTDCMVASKNSRQEDKHPIKDKTYCKPGNDQINGHTFVFIIEQFDEFCLSHDRSSLANQILNLLLSNDLALILLCHIFENLIDFFRAVMNP